MRQEIDSKLQDEQAGFCMPTAILCRPDNHTEKLIIIIEQSLEWNSSLYMNFVDFEMAFDSIDREVLRQVTESLRHSREDH